VNQGGIEYAASSRGHPRSHHRSCPDRRPLGRGPAPARRGRVVRRGV